MAEFNGSGTRTQRYAYLGSDFAPTQVQEANGTFYVHADHLDTPRLATSGLGIVIWKTRYEAFGKAVIDADPDGNSQTVTLNLRFPGQFADSESGSYYNFRRDYDPSTGRYLQTDPIGLRGGPNPYLYVNANPLSFGDPAGLFQWHGNWGGPGWGAERAVNEEDLTEEDFKKPYTDNRDQCYKIHDRCIWQCFRDQIELCGSQGGDARDVCKRKCDHVLASCLRGLSILDPEDSAWSTKPDNWLLDHLQFPAAIESVVVFDILAPFYYHGGLGSIVQSVRSTAIRSFPHLGPR